MASKKPQINIPVPATGVRRDVDPLVQTPEMAAEGVNCIYFDGTIRPRPALDIEVQNYIELESYQKTLDGDYWATQLTLSGDSHVTAMVQQDDQDFILAALASEEWLYSLDNGITWGISSVDWPAVGERVEKIFIEGDYIFAFTYELDIGPPVSAYLRCYRSPVATFPGSGSWTMIGEFSTAISTDEDYWSYNYDSDHDAFVVFYTGIMVMGEPWLSAFRPNAFVIYDASGAYSTDVVSDSIDIGEFGYELHRYVTPLWLDNSKLVYTIGLNNSSAEQIVEYVAYDSFEWTGSEYELTRETLGAHAKIWEVSEFERRPVFNPLNISAVESFSLTTIGSITGFLKASDNELSFIYTAVSGSDAPSQCIAKIEYDDDSLISPSIARVADLDSTLQVSLKGYGRTSEKIVYAFVEAPYNQLPALMVSSDDGATYLKSNTPATEVFAGFSDTYFNDVTDQHFFFYKEQGLGPDYNPFIWLFPTSLGPSTLGSITSMFQADMDNEDGAIFVGTTRAVARLDKDTGTWTRITADQLQCNPTGGGETDWLDSGDIPPLSAAPGSDEYVSGVTIDGTYGSNQWQFRIFPMYGRNMLVATNGQAYPIIYHEDMESEFARRIGEVPGTDPIGYIATDDYPNGVLAPRARCIATAANRLLLANNPNGSKYEVNVSAFNDADRGWQAGAAGQLVLLGDTPGAIVSMNEISALQVAVYKEDAIYHAVAQAEILGVSAPFRFELSKAGISGPCSPAAIQNNFDGRQIYLARDGGVYMYDGVAPIDGGRNIRRMVQGNIDLEKIGRAWGMVDRQRKLVWFFYPTVGGLVNAGIVISTDQGYPWPCWPIRLPDGWNFATGAEVRLVSDIDVGQLEEFDSYQEEALDSFSSGRTIMLVGRETGVFYTQKWDDNGTYNDSGLPIPVHLRTGWTTPGGVDVYTADELYHIFSSPDPEQELEIRLRAQQIGQRIKERGPSNLWAEKPRRRTRHRLSGSQFQVDIQGRINRAFAWGGAVMTIQKRGNRA